MPLVNTIKKNERTPAQRAAIEAYVPASDQKSEAAVVVARKGQRLDVDGVLARSIPTPGAFAIKDLKPVVGR